MREAGEQVLDGLLQAIVADPLDEDRWLVLADWLEEHDDPRRAELLRLHRRLLATCCAPERHPERGPWQTRVVELLTQGVRPCVPRTSVLLGDGVAMTFNFIPPGAFLMGSPPTETARGGDETQQGVMLKKGFWMGVTEVTQAQWQAVMGSNPSHFNGIDRPVEQVSGNDGQAFCGLLTERTSKLFRLPTEAEWEYACRAGTTTPFHFGETISTDEANYHGHYPYGKGQKGVYRQQTTPVGSFSANPWGLCDMHGNVWEWCQDWYGVSPTNTIRTQESLKNGVPGVLRGGSWANTAAGCRAPYRYRVKPNERDDLYGLRVCYRLD